MKKFKEYLVKNRKKNITLFFDIETLQYNEDEGRKKPSLYKNVTYAVGTGYIDKGNVHVNIFPNFKSFFDFIITTFKRWKTKPKIRLIAHNTNKYDNHFLRKDLIYYYNVKYLNLYLKNAIEKANNIAKKKTNVSRETKLNGVILEKRIKSSNNLELIFYLDGIEFYTVDNLVKTNISIDSLGKKMLSMGLVSEDELKTDFDYEEFNRDYDMTEEEAREYALKTFNSLTNKHFTYIRNDIILLAKSYMYYSKIFRGFDYEKITYTSNILEYYNDNDLTSYQLLKSIGKGKEKIHHKYTDYFFSEENFYDYLKSFYGGGLNFYNDKYVGKIIKDDIIAIDINSSYPYAMHKLKVPTFLKSYQEYKQATEIDIKLNDNEYFLYRMDKQTFDIDIISKIDSKIIRQMLIKYYGKDDYININSYTIRILNDIFKLNLQKITVLSYVSFETHYFGSRDKISMMYAIKEKGSSNKKLIYHNPYNIEVTNKKNTDVYSQDEIDIAKVKLNGLYGIPALRSHFNLFRWHDNGELYNYENGYENNERNIVFSVFVTSVALYNLLSPFKNLTAKEIDYNFLYCDTDSLYYRKQVHYKIDKDIFDKHALGKWDIDCDTITKFKVINHKKYAYEYVNKKGEKEIEIKCGGIPLESFNTNMDFDKFCETQFNDGSKIENKKSIYNKDGTISIYSSKTELQKGGGYRVFSYDPHFDDIKDRMIEEIKGNHDGLDDMIYIESNLGTFSSTDIFKMEHERNNKLGLDVLKMKETNIKNTLYYLLE